MPRTAELRLVCFDGYIDLQQNVLLAGIVFTPAIPVCCPAAAAGGITFDSAARRIAEG